MGFIEPLNLEMWFINVFSGDPQIFIAVALLVIFSLSGFFGLTILTMFMLVGFFLLMFSEFIGSSILFLTAVIGGLVIGIILRRLSI